MAKLSQGRQNSMWHSRQKRWNKDLLAGRLRDHLAVETEVEFLSWWRRQAPYYFHKGYTKRRYRLHLNRKENFNRCTCILDEKKHFHGIEIYSHNRYVKIGRTIWWDNVKIDPEQSPNSIWRHKIGKEFPKSISSWNSMHHCKLFEEIASLHVKTEAPASCNGFKDEFPPWWKSEELLNFLMRTVQNKLHQQFIIFKQLFNLCFVTSLE